jgi:hypothetical protein
LRFQMQQKAVLTGAWQLALHAGSDPLLKGISRQLQLFPGRAGGFTVVLGVFCFLPKSKKNRSRTKGDQAASLQLQKSLTLAGAPQHLKGGGPICELHHALARRRRTEEDAQIKTASHGSPLRAAGHSSRRSRWDTCMAGPTSDRNASNIPP